MSIAENLNIEEWWLISSMRRHRDSEGSPNLVDVIAASRGWNPLVPGESMTVTFGDNEYVITRRPADGATN